MRPFPVPKMNRLIFTGWMILSLSYASGCCCNTMIECYADKIDTVSDHLSEVDFDNCYHPECDLSRIGQPDWCRSRLNRMIFPDACCGGCSSGCRFCKSCKNGACQSCQQNMPCGAYETTAVTEISEPPAPATEESPSEETVPSEDQFLPPLLPAE